MTGQPTIAVLGTGTMGAPIARSLLRAGFGVRVWNRSAHRAEALRPDGAQVASAPAEAVTGADLVLTMLADGPAVDAVMDEAAPGLTPGMPWIQMSTVGVEWTTRLAAKAERYGVEFVDAPVSGSEEPARKGQLLILASGSDTARLRVQPVFDAIGRQTLWLGQAGMGTRLKLALNHWLAYLAEGMASTLALTQALGSDPRQFLDALGTGPLAALWAMDKARTMLSGDFTPAFPLRLALKDVSLAVDAAAAYGQDLPTTAALAARWRAAVAAGHGDEDVAAIIATLS